jgi:serine phosphatase RsbU (regulator of sigma subunit)
MKFLKYSTFNVFLFTVIIASTFAYGQYSYNIPKLNSDVRILDSANKAKDIQLKDSSIKIFKLSEELVKAINQTKKLEKSRESKTNENKSLNNFLSVYLIAAIVALVAVIFLITTIREKKQINKELANQHTLVKQSADNLKEKNKEITDSIKYARRIQEAMLPSKNEIKNILPNSFVYYRPKDIVSGDFYWVGEKNGKAYVVTADCTGHGVPGALMSMLGIANLNEIINEKQILSPAKILDELRNVIINSLTKTEGDAMKDGMDLSLYCLDRRLKRITYAAANNGIYIIRDGSIIILNPDKQPIGESPTKDRPFNEGIFDLKSDDMILTFTDGFADQFGGPKGKKYKYKQMQDLVIQLQKRPLYQMSDILNHEFLKWKGKLEQVDDVLLIGVRV